MDFTLKTLTYLLNTLKKQNFSFLTFSEFLIKPESKFVILRHDVDRNPHNALLFAQVQNDLGIKGTYYFRTVRQSYDPLIISQIAQMGHEIGYHYEDVSVVGKRYNNRNNRIWQKNDKESQNLIIKLAIKSFKDNLFEMRKIVPVKTICMHGSPLSRWDNRILWEHFDYKDFDLIGEPYFDIDFKKILYLTDTGRRWDGDLFNIRDKARNEPTSPLLDSIKLHSTFDIIQALIEKKMSDKIMFTFHPQRWTNVMSDWGKELCIQTIKNYMKFLMVKFIR